MFSEAAPEERSFNTRNNSGQNRLDARDESIVGVCLTRIPHHDTPEARERPGMLDDRGQLIHRQVSRSSSFGVGRHADEDFDILVLGSVLGPVVPCVEIEVVRIRVDAAVVVVELNPNRVKGNSTVEHFLICCVRERALRRRAQEVLLAGITIHERTKCIRKWNHVKDSALEIEIESINNGITERTEGITVCYGSESLPNQSGTGFRGLGTLEAAFAIGGTADGK